jgi:3'-phosphoadenosine 5'-phosphosulfate (PAPS) 3'-phosphatase
VLAQRANRIIRCAHLSKDCHAYDKAAQTKL